MPIEVLVILAVLAIGGYGWWHYRRKAAAALLAAEEDPSSPHNHARAYEMAKVQAELQRWSGPQ